MLLLSFLTDTIGEHSFIYMNVHTPTTIQCMILSYLSPRHHSRVSLCNQSWYRASGLSYSKSSHGNYILTISSKTQDLADWITKLRPFQPRGLCLYNRSSSWASQSEANVYLNSLGLLNTFDTSLTLVDLPEGDFNTLSQNYMTLLRPLEIITL